MHTAAYIFNADSPRYVLSAPLPFYPHHESLEDERGVTVPTHPFTLATTKE